MALGTETRAQLGASDSYFPNLECFIMYRDREDAAATGNLGHRPKPGRSPKDGNERPDIQLLLRVDALTIKWPISRVTLSIYNNNNNKNNLISCKMQGTFCVSSAFTLLHETQEERVVLHPCELH